MSAAAAAAAGGAAAAGAGAVDDATLDPLKRVVAEVQAELSGFFVWAAAAENADAAGDAGKSASGSIAALAAAGKPLEFPAVSVNSDIKKGDLFVQLGGVCGKNRLKPQEFVPSMTALLNAYIAKEQGKAVRLLRAAEAARTFLNVFIQRAPVFEMVVGSVSAAGEQWGHSTVGKGQRVLVEHTSSNPNAPLHIGNLRNSIIGSTLANVMSACGYDVKEHFYVNDLGAQIGLTALGYIRVSDVMEPKLKIDHWIGIIYAVMNTLSELQKAGADVPAGYEVLRASTFASGAEAAKAVGAAKAAAAAAGTGSVVAVPSSSGESAAAAAAAAAAEDGASALNEVEAEYWDILFDLRARQHELCDALVKATGHLDIKTEAGKLNLAYERNEPEAVKIFRKMVIADLAGVRQTLDRFGVRHDAYDFESELGWEGSNDSVLDYMKASPYFVAQTDKNDKGVPEGAHLTLAEFIQDKGMKTGKGGYPIDYPNMYVLRPDGSTLYTFRDVVYSLKKESQADIVLNVICDEQGLAQEKVALSLELLHPAQGRKQYHMTYAVVKLLRDGKEVKMSGRRGRYILADDLHEEIIAAVTAREEEKNAAEAAAGASPTPVDLEPGEDPNWRAHAIKLLSAAAMKYALLNCNPRTKINFDVQKAVDTEEGSGVFLLYNCARMYSLMRKHAKGVKEGHWPDVVPAGEVDWSVVQEDDLAWDLLWNTIAKFPQLVVEVGKANFPAPPALPEFPLNFLLEHLDNLVRTFSRYWRLTPKILVEGTTEDSDHGRNLRAQLALVKAVQATLKAGLGILAIPPLRRI